MFWKKKEKKPDSIIEEKPIIASLKKSLRRGFWQVKNSTHEHFSLHGFQDLFDEIVSSLDFDPNDRNQAYIIRIWNKPIENYQASLKEKIQSTENIDFEVIENRIGKEINPGWLPKYVLRNLNDTSTIWIRIEKWDGKEIWSI